MKFCRRKPIALTILLLLCLVGCGAKSSPIALNQRQVTTGDLFHEDGIYLFLKPDSSEDAFRAEFGVTREAINEAANARHRRMEEADPAFVFSFEGVPAMVLYSGPKGFGLLLNFTEVEPAALQSATEAILNELEAQSGTRPELNRKNSTADLGTAQIRISYQDVEDLRVINALTITYAGQK